MNRKSFLRKQNDIVHSYRQFTSLELQTSLWYVVKLQTEWIVFLHSYWQSFCLKFYHVSQGDELSVWMHSIVPFCCSCKEVNCPYECTVSFCSVCSSKEANFQYECLESFCWTANRMERYCAFIPTIYFFVIRGETSNRTERYCAFTPTIYLLRIASKQNDIVHSYRQFTSLELQTSLWYVVKLQTEWIADTNIIWHGHRDVHQYT
jgi:hypothetical protein